MFDQYIQHKYAISIDGNIENMGQKLILPVSFIDSP